MQLSNYGDFPTKLPIIVEDELFLYPFMISPIFLTEEKDILSVNHALEADSLALVVTSKSNHEGKRGFEDVFDTGVIGTIMRKVSLPDGRVKILFQGLAKGKIVERIQEDPLLAVVDMIENKKFNELKINATLEILKEKVRTLSTVSNLFHPDLLKTIEENDEPNRLADLISSTIKLKKEQAYELFSESDLEKRLFMLIELISEEIKANKLQREIKSKVHSKIEQVNKEYFLKEQLKQIQQELGTDTQREEEIEEYRQKLEDKKQFLNEDAYKEINKQIDRFSRMHPDSADSNIIQGYLDWVLDIPYGKFSKRKLDIHEVKKQLEADHYSLEKPKERIEEYFAVKELMQLRGIKSDDNQAAIICFAGPPGVGKTSLANSIAKALKRKLVRIALGGLEDVNELRGHRRTYIGAMPGRIVQGLIEAKEMDPVMVLDEIDKVARSHRGDPTAVLLEILDPEQNREFRDYYLNFNLDLSRVIFIATANEVGHIPAPLRDRMEFIFLSSYTPQEKYQIAKKYLIPQELKKHGLKNAELSIHKAALELMISNYTREAGVRNLRRKIAVILRKVAKQILLDSEIKKITITTKNLPEYLDKEVFSIDEKDKYNQVGVVNGLAWTSVGGDVLKIEALKIEGKGALQLTGSLGDVMKESARIALSVVKVLIDTKKLKIDTKKIPQTLKEREEKIPPKASDIYKRYDLHIHVPEGATPKDGPSAGIAMVTVIASILSDTKVRADVAMTGEVTLVGKVLPIGGLKEKLIAAYTAKMKTILIPQKNYENDLDDIPSEVLDALEIIGVKHVNDVLKVALI
jgi:ATP-dependent Lon protease